MNWEATRVVLMFCPIIWAITIFFVIIDNSNNNFYVTWNLILTFFIILPAIIIDVFLNPHIKRVRR